jgi:hypothetical protein
MSPAEIEDAIRRGAAIAAAVADRNLDDALALEDPGPAWCLALWLAELLESTGTDPARFAETIIGDSLAFEAAA